MTQSPDQDPQRNQQPIVVQQSGNGNGTAIGLVIAAVILAGGAIWAVTIWSNTQQKMIDAPAEAIKEGTKAIRREQRPSRMVLRGPRRPSDLAPEQSGVGGQAPV